MSFIVCDFSFISEYGGGFSHYYSFRRYISSAENNKKYIIILSDFLVSLESEMPILHGPSFTSHLRFSNKFIYRLVIFPLYLRSLSKFHDIDYVFFFGGYPLSSQLPFRVLHRDVKFLYQENLSFFRKAFLSLFYKRYSHSQKCFFLSNFSKSLVEDYLGLALPCHLVNHGSGFSHINSSFSSSSSHLHIVLLGRVIEYKRHDLAITFAELLVSSGCFSKITLDFIGQISSNDYKSLLDARISTITSDSISINFKGVIPKSRIKSVLINYDLGLMFSDYEAFGQSVYDYLESGLPVLFVDNSIFRELFISFGFFVSADFSNFRNFIDSFARSEIRHSKIIQGDIFYNNNVWSSHFSKLFE